MPLWVEVILEIIKITVPALIVFLTVYTLFKSYTDQQLRLRSMELKKEDRSVVLPLKLQACERLSLFCDRISLRNLLFRVRDDSMTADTLKTAMMVAIQQEYEHNISQQIYVSGNLWKIVTFAKNDTINVIHHVRKTVDENAGGYSLQQAIFAYLEEVGETSTDKARLAIATEVNSYMD